MVDVALPTVQGLNDTDSMSPSVTANATGELIFSSLTLIVALSGLEAPQRWDDIRPYTTPDQLSDELLTLSLMPRSRWQTLLNLETIKVCSFVFVPHLFILCSLALADP